MKVVFQTLGEAQRGFFENFHNGDKDRRNFGASFGLRFRGISIHEQINALEIGLSLKIILESSEK